MEAIFLNLLMSGILLISEIQIEWMWGRAQESRFFKTDISSDESNMQSNLRTTEPLNFLFSFMILSEDKVYVGKVLTAPL